MTSTRGGLPRVLVRFCDTISTSGRAKASVFPVPVRALPIKSTPLWMWLKVAGKGRKNGILRKRREERKEGENKGYRERKKERGRERQRDRERQTERKDSVVKKSFAQLQTCLNRKQRLDAPALQDLHPLWRNREILQCIRICLGLSIDRLLAAAAAVRLFTAVHARVHKIVASFDCLHFLRVVAAGGLCRFALLALGLAL